MVTLEKITNPDPKGTQTLIINKSKRRVMTVFRLFFIQDGEFVVALAPSLNLSGYGKTKELAKEMFKEVMDDYFDRLTRLKKEALTAELAKYGWKHSFLSEKKFENTAQVDKHGVLRNLKMPMNTPIEESTVSAAA